MSLIWAHTRRSRPNLGSIKCNADMYPRIIIFRQLPKSIPKSTFSSGGAQKLVLVPGAVSGDSMKLLKFIIIFKCRENELKSRGFQGLCYLA